MGNLAREDDPYLDAFGKVIAPIDNRETDLAEYTERRLTPLFSKFRPAKLIDLTDAPDANPQQLAVIAAVVGLRMMGLEFNQIKEVLNTDDEEISRISELPSTQNGFDRIFRSIINLNADTVQGRIAARASDAADIVNDMMRDVEVRDDVRLKAAQDILDRSGTHADHFFAQDKSTHRQEDELRITIMDADGERERVSVEVKRK